MSFPPHRPAVPGVGRRVAIVCLTAPAPKRFNGGDRWHPSTGALAVVVRSAFVEEEVVSLKTAGGNLINVVYGTTVEPQAGDLGEA